MNRYGTLDVAAREAGAPELSAMAREPWTLKGQVLDCRTEISAAAGDVLIPPSLRPAIPSYGGFAVSRFTDTPVGAFNLAELRVGVRVGAIASFVVVGAVCDSEAARTALAERWGYRTIAGEVSLQELYHQVLARVSVAGRPALQLKFSHRKLLPGTRLNVPSIVNLASREGRLVLAHAPVNAVYAQADGGSYAIEAFDGEVFGAGRAFQPSFPMSAAFGPAEITIGAVDYLIDPVTPAEESLSAVA